MADQFNTAYVPRSKGRSPGTLIPTNMAVSAQYTLDNFEAKHGDIDEFVMHRLGYDSKGQLYDRLYAEQIDSLALSFDQKDRDQIFLNGDQTGNGKGRFGAASIIDAKRRGYMPVFVTKNPQLYKSMLEDLADIGFTDITPFITNNEERITLDNGRILRTGNATNQAAEMNRITQQQDLGGYDVIFTTYTQLQTVNKENTVRRSFLLSIAERSSFILDEAHEAGGSIGGPGWRSRNAQPNRADFVRAVVDRAGEAVFMSATATKDPAVMDLYARRTDARHAVTSMEKLENTLKAGGIPLQQMMATQFVAAGNMLRRERSYENISFEAKQLPVDHGIADGIAGILRAVDRFDRAKTSTVKTLNEEVRKEAKRASEDSSIGQSGAKSTSFSSLMHNAIEQGLLAQKAEATVQEAIAALERGEKPLIAVANTMDSFIGNFVKDRGIQTGDPINISFADVLERYLNRSRDITLTDYDGTSTRRPLTDDELGAEGMMAFEEARELIAATDLSTIPLSSIDYIKHRLAQEGYSADEITGRQSIVNYEADGSLTYGLRPASEIKTQGKINVVNRFNGGQLDVVILNRSGATGINLHASERFADQRPRHMIMAQAERDINQVFQMFGRANRFGQVVEPKFTLVMADVPAEKRLGALLVRKMATLNANTTAARDSDLSVGNVTDFMNAAGEEVVAELLEEHPEIDAMLSYPSHGAVGGTDFPLISRTTGRIPLLPINQQQQLYDLIETETTALIQQKEAMGENVLEADKLNLDARTIAKMEVVPEDLAIKSEFTGPVKLEVVNAKVQTKPPTQLEVVNKVRENLGQPIVKALNDHDFEEIEDQAKQHSQHLITKVGARLASYRLQAITNAKSSKAVSHLATKFDQQIEHFQAISSRYPIGSSVELVSAQGKVSYGVITHITEKAKPLGSPAASTNWKMQILSSEGKLISVPFSKINTEKLSAVAIRLREDTWRGGSIYEEFDRRQQDQRTEMQIFTGNLIKAYQQFPEGKFVNFTDNQGQVRQGLIMPDGFDITEKLRERPVFFEEPYQVKAFLTEVTKNLGVVHDSPEKILAIKADASAKLRGTPIDHFVMTVPSATAVGGKFFMNEDLLDAAQSEFFSVANRMEMHVAPENLEAALKVLMKDEGVAIAAFDFKDMARNYLGQMLPTMEMIEDDQFEQQADFVPYVEPTKETVAQLDTLFQADAVEPISAPPVEPLPELLQDQQPEETVEAEPDIVEEPEAQTVDLAPEETSTPEIPEPVIEKLNHAIAAIQSFNEAIEAGRYLDQTQGGQGRYEFESFENRSASITQAQKTIANFRAKCLEKGVDAEQVLKDLGYVPPLEMSEAAKEWGRQPEENSAVEPEPLVQDEQMSLFQVQEQPQELASEQIKVQPSRPEELPKPESWQTYASALELETSYQTWVEQQVTAFHQEQSLTPQAENLLQQDHGKFIASLNSLREWHRVAKELNRSYLDRIVEVGQEFKQGIPLSKKAKATMKQDFSLLAYRRLSTDIKQTDEKAFAYQVAAKAAKAGMTPPQIMGVLACTSVVQHIRSRKGEQASLKFSRQAMLQGLGVIEGLLTPAAIKAETLT